MSIRKTLNITFDDISDDYNNFYLMEADKINEVRILEIGRDYEGVVSTWEPKEYQFTVYDKDGEEIFSAAGFNDIVNMSDYFNDYGRVVKDLGGYDNIYECIDDNAKEIKKLEKEIKANEKSKNDKER